MSDFFPLDNIPDGSILGLNYSGMHDTAIALVSPEGIPLFAISLERLSRVKQDGRFPAHLFEEFPWERIDKIALSVERQYKATEGSISQFLPTTLAQPNSADRSHDAVFLNILNSLPARKTFIPHHLCHAASAFWLSDFSSATCLVYDGGMSNEEWFGGVYNASIHDGIAPIDLFSANHHPMITILYTTVTVILGFTPLKHEGKITGLAARGVPDESCRKLLELWFHQPEITNGIYFWQKVYSQNSPPVLKVGPEKLSILKNILSDYKAEDIAATVQDIAERHITSILNKIISEGKAKENLCLSGGLFANVKINQKASELGFKHTYISPPMTDDGTALGAALHVASENSAFSQQSDCSMFLGPSYSPETVVGALTKQQVIFQVSNDPAQELAQLLAKGSVVAIYQGASEFGPRALGNRSILANANNPEINQILNDHLNRTEFMPFAPACLDEDADSLFFEVDRVRHAAKFMTVTLNCTDRMKKLCPAVVHCDGTARPQLVTHQSNPLLYEILSQYKEHNGKPALINTSFNVHEEPIVCSPEDAIRGFFESGLDVLFIEGNLVRRSENAVLEIEYIRNKLQDTLNEKKIEKKKYQEEIIAFQQQQKQILEGEIQMWNAKINELNQHAHHLWTVTEQQKEQIEAILTSTSWRMMAPIRGTKRIGQWGGRKLRSVAVAPARPFFISGIKFVQKHPGLKRRLLQRLRKFPVAEAHLRQFAILRGMNSAPAMAPSTLFSEPEVGPRNEISSLTPRTRRIYSQLKAAIEVKQKEIR